MKLVVGIIALATFFIYVVSQVAAGYAGIAHGLGPAWAWVAVFSALFLRFTLPLTVGAFFGAMMVWGWHWAFALVFVLPGLVFVIPGFTKAIFSLATTGSAKLTRATPLCELH